MADVEKMMEKQFRHRQGSRAEAARLRRLIRSPQINLITKDKNAILSVR
jgi:hypothetical protein